MKIFVIIVLVLSCVRETKGWLEEENEIAHKVASLLLAVTHWIAFVYILNIFMYGK